MANKLIAEARTSWIATKDDNRVEMNTVIYRDSRSRKEVRSDIVVTHTCDTFPRHTIELPLSEALRVQKDYIAQGYKVVQGY
jgi:hypothetical protein